MLKPIFTSSYQLCISSYYSILQVPLRPPDKAWPRHGPPPVQWQHRRPHGLLHRPGWVHCRVYQWQKYSWKQKLKLKIPQLKIFPCVAFLANPPVDKYLYILNVKYIFHLPLTDCFIPRRQDSWNDVKCEILKNEHVKWIPQQKTKLFPSVNDTKLRVDIVTMFQ